MSIYQKNLEIISERFPYLYLLLLSKNTLVEKRKSLKFSNKNIFEKDSQSLDTIYIYKCLDLTNQDLIKWLNNKDKKLIFLEDNLDDLNSFFHTKTAFDLLRKDNVSFYFIQNIKELNEILRKNLKANIDVITFFKKTKKFENLKQNIIEKSLISFFSNHDQLFSYKMFKNFIKNIDKLKSSFLVNKFRNSLKDKPAIILGAGPSLNYSYEKLKTLSNKALIIAGGSAICSTNQNIKPHLGVIIDPNLDEFKRLKNSLSFEMPMLFSTRVNSGVFNTFNGQTGYIKAAIGSFFEAWIDSVLKIPSKYLQNKHDDLALSVTTICVSLAKLFGCNPIILDGVDLAYTEDKYYASNIVDNTGIDIGNHLNKNQKDIGERPYLTKNKNNKEVFSNLKWKIENKWLSIFAKKYKKTKFINATKNGLKIDFFEDLSLDEIEKKYLNKVFDFEAYIHTLSQENMLTYVKSKDFTVLKLKLKNSFLNCKNYLLDILKNDPEYKAILAEEEIKDEIAYQYFLIEQNYTLKQFFDRDSKELIQNLLKTTNLFLREFDI